MYTPWLISRRPYKSCRSGDSRYGKPTGYGEPGPKRSQLDDLVEAILCASLLAITGPAISAGFDNSEIASLASWMPLFDEDVRRLMCRAWAPAKFSRHQRCFVLFALVMGLLSRAAYPLITSFLGGFAVC